MGKRWIFALLSMGILLLSACGDIGSGIITISVADTAKEYETMSYGEFKKQTGNEAEFYHADRFIGEILDSSLCVIYSGEYNENMEAVLMDDNVPIRLQGSLNDLMAGIPKEMTLTEFTEALSTDGAAKTVYEILEGGGTAYYVGDTYLQIQFDSDKDGELDRQLLISLDEVVEETIRPEYIAWLELL